MRDQRPLGKSSKLTVSHSTESKLVWDAAKNLRERLKQRKTYLFLVSKVSLYV